MRILFWILLLGNVILFAVMQRGGTPWGEQVYQAKPELHAEKIRLLDAPQSAPDKVSPAPASVKAPVEAIAQVAAPTPVATPAPAVNPTQVPKEAVALTDKPAPASKSVQAAKQNLADKPATAANKQNALVCLEWGDFSGDDLKRATELLSGLKLGNQLSQRQIEYDKGYWVYMPPQKNKAGVKRKISQLKERGVTEYFVIWTEGAMQYAISLGVFKTKKAAQSYLKRLRAKDVLTARVGERASKLNTTMFILNNVDTLIAAKLAEAKKDFPDGDLKNIHCALTR